MDRTASWQQASTYRQLRDQHLNRFGQMLRNWRIRNDWTQHTISQWGAAAGFQALAAGNLSTLERGLAGNPAPSTLFLLADVNQRLALRQYGTIRSADLRAKIQSAEPITDPDGTPWGPTEFWGASVGIHPIPADLLAPEPEPMPDADPEALGEAWRQQLAAAVLEHDLDPLDAVAAVAKLAPLEQRKRLRQVLMLPGHHYQPDELPGIWSNGWMPERVIQEWLQALHS